MDQSKQERNRQRIRKMVGDNPMYNLENDPLVLEVAGICRMFVRAMAMKDDEAADEAVARAKGMMARLEIEVPAELREEGEPKRREGR